MFNFTGDEMQERERTRDPEKQRKWEAEVAVDEAAHTCFSQTAVSSQLARHDFTTASLFADMTSLKQEGAYAIQHQLGAAKYFHASCSPPLRGTYSSHTSCFQPLINHAVLTTTQVTEEKREFPKNI